jgi:alpha-tubulin suppressor-like RCC1 family protein
MRNLKKKLFRILFYSISLLILIPVFLQIFVGATPDHTYTYGGYYVKVFTSTPGGGTWEIPAGVTKVDVLVVAGGGGGGSGDNAGGGGGAGGLIFETNYSVSGNLTVTVGAGGAASTNGSNSVFSGLTALGGGGGGEGPTAGSSGGSGGGGGGDKISSGTQRPAGGTATQPTSEDGGYGYNGGRGYSAHNDEVSGGGGGGAGAVGGNASWANAGDGGAGKDYSSYFGTSVGESGWFAGGGGGSVYKNAHHQGIGGNGGGGDREIAGMTNTGGGGGRNKAGGSGVVIVRYQLTEYTLTYTAGSGGSVTGTSPQTVIHGSDGSEVTAVPDEGYHFVKWSDDVMTESRTDTNVTDDIAVTANFAINEYTLTYIAESGGSVTGTSPQTVEHGSDGSEVTAVPDVGYHFVKWSDDVMTESRTDTNVTDDISVTASFELTEYTLTYTSGSGGSVTGTSPQTVIHGSDGSEVTAVPDEGYHFVKWSDDVMTESRTDTSVTDDITVTANFAINEYDVIYQPSSGGTVLGDTTQVVEYGSNSLPVTAVPEGGYYFVSWSDGVTDSIRADFSVSGDISVTGEFDIVTSSLQMNFSGKIVTLDGLDISYNSPSCIQSGADTCDFQIKYYDDPTSGNLLGSEVFSNVEVGAYRGYFNLKLGAGTFTPEVYSSILRIFLNEDDVYLEVLFDGSGVEDFEYSNSELERFLITHDPVERMAVGGSPTSISSRGAIDEFQLKVKTAGSGSTKGLMYFDGGENLAMVYDGTQWKSLAYVSMLPEEIWSASGEDIPFATGNVGIGTESTTSKLSVLGESNFEGNIKNLLSEGNLPEGMGVGGGDLSEGTNFALQGDYAYVTVDGDPAVLYVYDVSDKNNPKLISTTNLSYPGFGYLYEVHSLQIYNKYAYVLVDELLLVCNVSDPYVVHIEAFEDLYNETEFFVEDVTSLAAGEFTSLVSDSNGHVWAWGWNAGGAIGDGTYDGTYQEGRLVPVKVHGGEQGGEYLENIVEVDIGARNYWYVTHSIALDSEGHVWAWGDNDYGQLGDNSAVPMSNVPIQVLGGTQGGTYLEDIVAISAGGRHSIALDSSGNVWAWGYNNVGQLGDGSNTTSDTPVQVLSGQQGGGTYLHNIEAIVSSGSHNLALDTNNNVWSWGYNGNGQLGNNSTTSSNTPVQVLSGEQSEATYLEDVTFIGAGYDNSFAVDINGSVWSWGENYYGQLGDGTSGSGTDKSTPVRVLAGAQGEGYLQDIVSISGGNTHIVALDSNGHVWSWGRNYNSNICDASFLGDGTSGSGTNKTTAVQVVGGTQGGEYLNDITSVAVGFWINLALDMDGSLWAWGASGCSAYSLGDGMRQDRHTPVRVASKVPTRRRLFSLNKSDIDAISNGSSHSLALDISGKVWSWGDNYYGQLGDGTTIQQNIPIQVLGGAQGGTHLENIVSVSAGSFYSLALDSLGNVWAWGNNDNGRLGDGTTTQRETPIQVLGGAQGGTYLENIESISVGTHSLALDSLGNVWAWGSNGRGQLGNGTSSWDPQTIPIHVLGGEQGGTYLEDIESISAGGSHSLALDISGNVWAWGAGDQGQLGIGTSSWDAQTTPIRVLGGTQGGTYLEGIAEISAGSQHSMALNIDGNIWVCGNNGSGRLGDGTNVTRLVPVEVVNGSQIGTEYLDNIVSVSAGEAYGMALDSNGNIWSWGNNDYGQLGNGSLVPFDTAIPVIGRALFPNELIIQGRYGYVMDLYNSFITLDLSASEIDLVSQQYSDDVNIPNVSNLYGASSLHGKYMYILSNDTPSELVILDISDPSSVSLLSTTELSFDSADTLSVSGRYGYVTNGTHMHVLDLLDYNNVTEVSSLDFTTTDISTLTLSGRYAFALSRSSPTSLYTVDISDVETPTLFESVDFGTGQDNGRAFVVQGKYGYALTDGGIVVMDMKGIETNSLLTNSFETYSGFVRNDFNIGSNLSVLGGMNVGVGGIYSGGDLSIEGRLRILGGLGVGTGNTVYIDNNGYLVSSSSSIRYKKNIQPYGSVLSTLQNLEMVRFTWNEQSMSSGIRDVGMIAEDVARYIPDLVIYNKQGKPEGLKYDKMGLYAIKGLQELSEEFNTFKSTLGATDTQEEIYQSTEEYEVGTLVSIDFTNKDEDIENGIKVFDNTSTPLLGIISEVVEEEIEENMEIEEEITSEVVESEEVEDKIYSYHITPYTGFGNYPALVSRSTLEKEEENVNKDIKYPKGSRLGLGIDGNLLLLEEDDETSLVLGYTLQDITFTSETFLELTEVYLSYTPFSFGYNNFNFSSLLSQDSIYSGITLGGNLVNFYGKSGTFLILKTDMLNVADRIVIEAEGETPTIKLDGEDVVERFYKLKQRLEELEALQ